MMQVQGSNMMEMGTNSPTASFWGARHGSWSSNHNTGHNGQSAAAATSAGSSTNNDPKMAEKLMTELQVSQYKVRYEHIRINEFLKLRGVRS